MKNNRYYVIPDIHGRYDLLQAALNHIYTEEPAGCDIIFLGDYIDRGPQSGMVIKTIMQGKNGYNFIPLRGNHEDMYLEHHSTDAGWPLYDPIAALDVDATIGRSTAMNWIDSLPYFHIRGNNVFAHAFYDDGLSPDNQGNYECVWYRFPSRHSPYTNKRQGLYLTHGHTPYTDGPVICENRINLDTAAFHTGKLLVAMYEDGRVGMTNYFEIM